MTANPVDPASQEVARKAEDSRYDWGIAKSLGKEWLAYLLIVVVCDLTIYRSSGYSGYSAAMLIVPGLLALGSPHRCLGLGGLVICGLIAGLALKGFWCGSVVVSFSGIALVSAFAYSLTGQTPQVIETIGFILQSFSAGYVGLMKHSQSLLRRRDRLARAAPWMNVFLPAVTCLVFGLIFILANPNLVSWLSEGFQNAVTRLFDWLTRFSLGEALFWLATLWISVGFLRPIVRFPQLDESEIFDMEAKTANGSPLAEAFRNTLIAVVVLFAVYLVFEFQSLWFRVFPVGFHYSGYAHQGAAWLTVALALATLFLSLIFRGPVLFDERLPRLRRLAWIWSLENFVLAIAVYHRLSIYVGFNGMTYMRMIGFFGITCVVIGFILVLVKIARRRSFLWLIRRQLAALALAIVVFAMTPVDWIVMRYNVSQVLRGHIAPSVEISVHNYSAEGWLGLLPLTDCDDIKIRNGVRALLARRWEESQAFARDREQAGWTKHQFAEQRLYRQLNANQETWSDFTKNHAYRDNTIREFDEYVYQWY